MVLYNVAECSAVLFYFCFSLFLLFYGLLNLQEVSIKLSYGYQICTTRNQASGLFQRGVVGSYGLERTETQHLSGSEEALSRLQSWGKSKSSGQKRRPPPFCSAEVAVSVEVSVCWPTLELLAVSMWPYYLPRKLSHVIYLYIPSSANADAASKNTLSVVARLQTQHPDAFITISCLLHMSRWKVPSLCSNRS